MTSLYMILTIIFIIIAVSLVLIILIQRPQGGGLAGAFGGAGGGGTDSVFGGRVGDALTYMTIGAFGVYLLLAISLNLINSRNATAAPPSPPETVTTEPGEFSPEDVFIAPSPDSTSESGNVFVPETTIEPPPEPVVTDTPAEPTEPEGDGSQ